MGLTKTIENIAQIGGETIVLGLATAKNAKVHSWFTPAIKLGF